MVNNFNSYGDWELRQQLGSGSYGEVLLWINRRTNEEIATKSLKQINSLGPDEEHKLKERWQQEFTFSKNLDTDFIVRSMEITDKQFMNYLNNNHALNPLPVMVMEYCNGGDLRAHLQQVENINGLGEYEIRNILYSVRNAVHYIHNQCNIKHRDLKPDNIVIQNLPNGERRYKLTDFGFARYINDATILQSVVGTRNYVAPEIVDTSFYTKSVDYWSMGIIAFEMLCGTLPFIPHQFLIHIIKLIKAKPNECIAITQKYGELPNNFEKHERIFEENHVSTIFRNKIERWLRLALDKNYKTRGTEMDPNGSQQCIHKFYHVLDELLQTCVLTTFNLSAMTFHDFEIKFDSNTADFVAELCRATNIPQKSLHLILPVGHPLQKVSYLKHPMDLFVPEWQKTNEIMLYIVDDSIKDLNAILDPKISETIRQCLEKKTEKLPMWLLQKFAFDTHFSIANGQYHLKTICRGIKEYAMDVENEILDFRDKIEEVIRESDVLSGRIQQYESMISVASGQLKRLPVQKKLHDEFFSTWEQSIKDFKNKIHHIKSNALSRVQERNISALRRIREELCKPFYDEKIINDAFALNQFREHLRQHQGIKIDDLLKINHICKYCYDAVYLYIKKRYKIIEEIKKKRSMPEISGINDEYVMIRTITDRVSKMLQCFHDDIVNKTNEFHEAFIEILTTIKPLTNGKPQIYSDGSINQSTMPTSINGLCHSMIDIMHLSTNDLIRDVEETMELMSLDFNVNDSPHNINSN